MYLMVLAIVASRSSQTGSAWVTATLTVLAVEPMIVVLMVLNK